MYVYRYEQRLHLLARSGYNDPLFTTLYRVGLSYMSNILHFYRQVNFGESPKMKKTECTRRLKWVIQHQICSLQTLPVIKTGFSLRSLAGVCCGPCNPSKWEAEFWGWLEVWRPALLCFTVNQRLHWACWQYGHSGGTQRWLGVGERVIWAAGYIQQLEALLASNSGICCFTVSTV